MSCVYSSRRQSRSCDEPKDHAKEETVRGSVWQEGELDHKIETLTLPFTTIRGSRRSEHSVALLSLLITSMVPQRLLTIEKLLKFANAEAAIAFGRKAGC